MLKLLYLGSLAWRKLRSAIFGVNVKNLKDVDNLIGNKKKITNTKIKLLIIKTEIKAFLFEKYFLKSLFTFTIKL